MTRMMTLALALVVVSAAGCARMSVMSSGHLALDLGGASSNALSALPMSHTAPAVLEAFDAQHEGAALSDPNSRAGANCAGGV